MIDGRLWQWQVFGVCREDRKSIYRFERSYSRDWERHKEHDPFHKFPTDIDRFMLQGTPGTFKRIVQSHEGEILKVKSYSTRKLYGKLVIRDGGGEPKEIYGSYEFGLGDEDVYVHRFFRCDDKTDYEARQLCSAYLRSFEGEGL